MRRRQGGGGGGDRAGRQAGCRQTLRQVESEGGGRGRGTERELHRLCRLPPGPAAAAAAAAAAASECDHQVTRHLAWRPRALGLESLSELRPPRPPAPVEPLAGPTFAFEFRVAMTLSLAPCPPWAVLRVRFLVGSTRGHGPEHRPGPGRRPRVGGRDGRDDDRSNRIAASEPRSLIGARSLWTHPLASWR